MSELLDPLFGAPEVDDLFSTEATIEALLRVEAALAATQGELGLIPIGPARWIEAVARAGGVDVGVLAADAARDGNLVIPLVRQLKTLVGDEAAEWVHYGVTSQDVLDTALVGQLVRAIEAIETRGARAAGTAFSLADRHATTPMAARTWLQQATPTSFGLVMAGYGEALDRGVARLRLAKEAAAVLQLGGATGTLASLGGRSDELAPALGEVFGLAVPTLSWHSHRDRLAEVAAALGILAGVGGKIGRDISLLMQSEVAEVREGEPGGSSAMPQKANPVRSAVAIAAATRAPGLVATVLASLPQEHQRSVGLWPAEWETIPLLVRVVAGGVRAVEELLAGLVVDPARMTANLSADGGLIFAEALVTTLGGSMSPGAARGVVARLVAACRRGEGTLRALASADPEVAKQLDAAGLARTFDPAAQLGGAAALVKAARAAHR